MIDRERIQKIIKEYLPNANEELINTLTIRAEKQIEHLGIDVIRNLVSLTKGQGQLTTKIDTKI